MRVMRVNKALSFLALLLILGLLTSCGGGPGAPGSCDTEKTGVILDITISPYYQNVNNLTSSVDIVQSTCTFGETEYPEYFADHSSIIDINARLINPNPPIQPGTLYIEKYTIKFIRSNDSIGAPPIESDTRYQTIVVYPPSSGTGSTNTKTIGVLVDLIRKEKYLKDILSGQYNSNLPHNFTAVYTFEGKNQYGKSFCAVATTSFQIGSYDYCSIKP